MTKPVLDYFSPVVAGTMSYGKGGKNLAADEVAALIRSTVSEGITTFDMADIYGDYTTEALFGKGFRKSGISRESVQFITKCGIKAPQATRPDYKVKHYDTSYNHIVWSAENSLRQLDTDYIDLLLVHRPDPLMHPQEMAEAFIKLQKKGKVRHFGVSNFTPTQFTMVNAHFPLVTNQVEASLSMRSAFLDGTLDVCLEKGIRPMAWSPLGKDLLTGSSAAAALLKEMAGKHQATPAQILVAWLLKHPSGILPVMGTTRPERLREAWRAQHIELSRQEWFALWEAAEGKEVP